MDSLQRFVDAQAGVVEDACAELRAGCKQSHWMWFIFPQLRGPGHSAMAQHYGIASGAEALAYWQHPLLGPRLKHCMQLLLAHEGLSAQDMLGAIDALKLRSCATAAWGTSARWRCSVEFKIEWVPSPCGLCAISYRKRSKCQPRSCSARAMRWRCTVVLGTLNGNQLRTSSSSPMPCM